MNRRIITWNKIFLAALACAIVFLSLLPTLGWTWHHVLPEHDHWLIGNDHVDLHHDEPDPSVPVTDECLDCAPLPPNASLIHSPGSTGALQILAMAGIFARAILPVPLPEFSSRVVLSSAVVFLLALPLADPPPKTD